MRKFNITVNGKAYVVDVEEIGAGAPAQAQVAAPVAAPVQAAPTAPAAPANTSGIPVKSPMPGTIVDIKVSEGQSVKSGDVLVILEAMKMENDIVAPEDGVVKAINVAKGASVNSDDLLITLG